MLGVAGRGEDPLGNVKEFALLLLLEGFGEGRFRFAF